jgi:uncharacterized repeat protein (TIGR03803 family)
VNPRAHSVIALLFAVSLLPSNLSAAGPQEKVLYAFQGGTDGALANGNLVADKNGNLYGTTYRGGLTSGLCEPDEGCGVVFELKPPAKSGGAWTESVIYRFGPYAHPAAGLALDSAGNLYGTTQAAGTSNNGTVFQLMAPAKSGGAWTENTLYNFAGGQDGASPVANLIFDDKGNLYGTTQFGGGGPCTVFQQGNGCGTVFELTRPTAPSTSWTETILYSFIPANDYPVAGLIRDASGNLYGTTEGDQSASFGTVFELSPPTNSGDPWTQTTLYFFGSVEHDGITPFGGVISDAQGNLYGTTNQGGVISPVCTSRLGCGTVFELARPTDPASNWSEKTLYSFADGVDGALPYAGVVADKAGNLYGTTYYGGDRGNGIVFELQPPVMQGGPWTEAILHRFAGGSDGQGPDAPLLITNKGLFGSTAQGGGTCAFPFTCGTIFQVVP